MPWRKRQGIEPSDRPHKDRPNGFEVRGSHQAPCASGWILASRSARVSHLTISGPGVSGTKLPVSGERAPR